MKQNQNWKIPHTLLERRTLCFNLYNRKLKLNMWCIGAHERNNKAFFVLFILTEENFSNICVLSQCEVY